VLRWLRWLQVAPRDSLQRPGASVLGWITCYAQDRFTPICPDTAATLAIDLGIVHAAVESMLRPVDPVSHALALITLPGHHSTRNSFGGYCYINHCAVAARLFRKRYARVAVVDVDYHAGNGGMNIHWDDPTVLFASLHMSPDYDYPFCAGFADQVGGPGAEGATINVPLLPGTDWPAYRAQLADVLKRVVDFGAEVCVCVCVSV
jgi:acetoin utilization deacetylase AcuC-like enzyme